MPALAAQKQEDSGLALVPRPEESLAVALSAAYAAQTYFLKGQSPNTERVYKSAWKLFVAWCKTANLCPLPATPETITAYVAAQAQNLKAATLNHRVAAIVDKHKAEGFDNPIRDHKGFQKTMKGIHRFHGTAQVQKSPVLTEDLRMMLRQLPKQLIGTRDRAILLVGFAGAFRRSELVSLDVGDLSFSSEGLTITLRRSKTDQEAMGRKIAVPTGKHAETCPVRALRAWLDAAAITDGAIFRPANRHGKINPARLSGEAVADVVKRHCAKAGMDPKLFAGHSLRAGFVTSAARAGAPDRHIQRVTGHKSLEMLGRYIREANSFAESPLGVIGL